MSKVSEDLNKAEDDIIKAFRIAQETVNEIQNLPDTNAERIRQLSKSFFEIVTNVRNIIYETHGEIRNSAAAISQEQQPTTTAANTSTTIQEFDLEIALEALANDSLNINSNNSITSTTTAKNNSRR